MDLEIERPQETRRRLGIAKSTYEVGQKSGILPKSFNIGPRAKGTLKHETTAIIAARANNVGDDELRRLSRALEGARAHLLSNFGSLRGEDDAG